MGEPPPPLETPLQSPSLPLSETLSSFSLSHLTTTAPPSHATTTSRSAAAWGGGCGREKSRYATFERLPPELIERIARWLIRSTTTTGPPAGVVTLLLISKRFDYVLNLKRNKGFYADLFKERFDSGPVERRWSIMRTIEEKREKVEMLKTLPESKPSEEIHLNPAYSFARPCPSSPPPSSFSLDGCSDDGPSPPGHPPVSSTSPTSGFENESYPPQPPPSAPASSGPSSPWDPLTNRDYANELVRRCQVLTKMRIAATLGGFKPTSSRPASPRLMSFTPTRGRTRLNEPDELTQNLWTCYLMLLENDGKNLPHLLEYACLREYMRLFYRHSLLAEALNPGWPRQTAGRALGLWIGWLGGDDLGSETAQESEERFFVLKPYVFAAHKFDAFLAPWTIRSLPVTHEEYPVVPPPAGPYLADLRPRSQAQTVTHMGRKLDLSPPNLSHAAIFSFFFRVEQDPAVQSDLLVQGTNTPAQHQQTLPAPFGGGLHAQQPHHNVGGLTAQSRPTKTTLPALESRIHDRDFIRLASCIDPYTSRGLPTLYTRGDLSGNWEGRFSFFDFDSYRDMLGGRMRSLYEGPFGDQPQVWKLEERVVKLEPVATAPAQARGTGGGGTSSSSERSGATTATTTKVEPGGTGPVLNAGFEIGGGGDPLMRPSIAAHRSASTSRIASTSQSPPPVARRRRAASNGTSEPVILEILEDDETLPFGTGPGSRGGDGEIEERAAKKRIMMNKRSSLVGGAFWEDDELDEYGRRKGEELEDGDYEILLTGSGHSAWGQFNLKGRVRAWDGMFTIIKEYTPDSRGRWIYRGYRIGDSLVGRWRDTHTPVDMSGYEGTWSMTRRK